MRKIPRQSVLSFALRERARRLVAGCLLLAFLASGLFSVLFVAHEAEHDCCGHDCPVCLALAQCAATLQLLGASRAPAQSVATLLSAPATPPLSPALAAIPRAAPVSLKVRLDL